MVTGVSSSGPDPVERDSRGILDPWLLRQRVQLTRYPAGPAMAGLVDRFWAVRWDLPPGTVHRQQVLTHPGANFSIGNANGRPGETQAGPIEARLNNREIRRLAELCDVAGLGRRTLQRMFLRYAGVSPTWVLRRYRLLEAAEAVREGQQVSWAEVAAGLGYADQAHLIRDFRAAIGQTPAAYADSQSSR